MLAFKIMSFEYVGSITFCRIYSGKLESGMALTNTTRDKKERVGRMYLMHAADREEIKEAYAGDIVALRASRIRARARRCAIRNKPVMLEKMEFPEPRHRDEDRAQDQGRSGEDVDGAVHLAIEDPSFRVVGRPGVRRDDPQGHGRASSRHQGRHPEAHLRRRRQCRRPAGCLSRDARARRPTSTTRTRSRPAAPASSRASSCALSPTRRARATSSSPRSSAARCRRSTSPASRRASTRCGQRRPHRLPDGRHQGRRCTTAPSTKSTRRRHRLRNRRPRGDAGRLRQGRREAARADHGRRGGDAGDFVGGVIGDINSRRGQIRNQEMRGNANVIRASCRSPTCSAT